MSLWLSKDTRAPSRLLFNAAATALAIWVSGTVYYSFAGVGPHLGSATPIHFIPLAVFTLLYFLLNTWFVAFAVAVHHDRSPLSVWWPHFPWLSINYFSGASLAALIVTYTKSIDFSTLLIFVPLLVITYFTFRTVMARFDDSTKHLDELNRLYLSTIETLAMAIDAKDQITHGHIRRVQAYAVGLARHVGVKDERLIKAVEAAALLHDMGKLAVPEYILNKPGRLTDAEFAKMKLHASVGADILSAINFPYPVVPIVRHHHEHWDGNGYPDELRGTDIPIGARILSVVDCFDALTSDRPYRPRLSDEEAIAILRQRRGSMYDPLVVDTFIEVYKELAPDAAVDEIPRAGLTEIAGSTNNALMVLANSAPQFEAIAASRDEGSTIHTMASALSAAKTTSEVGDIISKHVFRLVPFSLFVLYIYDRKTDEIEARYVTGEIQAPIKHMRINLGAQLSGWVAANRQTIVNSDPVLDLGEIARHSNPKLRSCLSTPIVANSTIVGVFTLYSSNSDQFTDEHRRVIETVAQHSAHTIERSLASNEPVACDPVTGLPYLAAAFSGAAPSEYQTEISPGSTTLWIDIVGLNQINERFGSTAGNAALLHVARCLRSELHSDDRLFRYKSDEFIAILKPTDPAALSSLSSRIKAKLETPTAMRELPSIRLEVVVRHVHTTANLTELEELINRSGDAKTATHRFHIH
jgi:diguanylate cyclase (GGDEF)-like protein/putative nucleotidyltransferase with HDIG domain